MGLVDSLFVFVVSLLIGGIGIHAGSIVVLKAGDYRKAVRTAFWGAVVWAVAGFLVGWIPFLGPVLTLLAYVGVIEHRYGGGWVTAGGIALVAWIATLGTLYVLAFLDVTAFGAVGVPGI